MGVCISKAKAKKSQSNQPQGHQPKRSSNTLNINHDNALSPRQKPSQSFSQMSSDDEKQIPKEDIKDTSRRDSLKNKDLNLNQVMTEKENGDKRPADTQLNTHLETNQIIKETTFEKLINQTAIEEPLFDEKLFSFSKERKDFELCYFLNELHITNQHDFSSENEFNALLQSYTKQNKVLLVSKLLNLNERQWNKELMILSDLIKENREAMDNYVFSKYLKNHISIIEHFNWIAWALSYYYNYSFLSQKSNWFHVAESGLPNIDSIDWLNGFEWKGLFIRVQSKEKSKALMNEVKAINYAFFDFIQIIDTRKLKDESLLSNELIFPLISYAEIGGLVLFATPCISKVNYDYGVGTFDEKKLFKLPSMKPRKTSSDSFININGKERESNQTYMPLYKKYTLDMTSIDNMRNGKRKKPIDINDFSHIDANSIHSLNLSNIAIANEDIDLKKYSMIDLEESQILRQITSGNLIKVINDLSLSGKKDQFKLMLVNAVDLIPNLLGSPSEVSNFISFDEATKKRKEVTVHSETKKELRDVLENDYGIVYSPSLCAYGNIFSSFQYKVIYDPSAFKHKELNSKLADDFLVNLLFKQNDTLVNSIKASSEIRAMFNLSSLDIAIPNDYTVLYSLRYPTKQKYSLIKTVTSAKDKAMADTSFISRSNFISHFRLFCSKLNRKSSLIRTTQHLKLFFHRHGINFSLQMLALPQISNKTVADLIKLSVFVNVIKDFFSFHESSNLIMKMFLYEATHDIAHLRATSFNFHQDKEIQAQSFIAKAYTINEIRKEKILQLIKAVLYPSEVTDGKYTTFIYEQLSFFLLLKTMKWKVLAESMQFSGMTFDVKALLKEFTSTARELPFIWLTSLEEALNVVISPFTKFKSSFSLHSMSNNALKLDDLILNDPIVTSVIRPKEISGYLLAKCITISNSFEAASESKAKPQQGQHKVSMPVNTMKSLNAKVSLQQYTQYNNDLSKNASFLMNSNNITNLNLVNDKSFLRTANNNKSSFIDITNHNGVINTNPNLQPHKKEIEGNYFNWKDIADSFLMTIPSICYKLPYQQDESLSTSSLPSKSKAKSMHRYLSHCYSFGRYDCINDWKNAIESLFNGVTSSNGECERSLLRIYLFVFINHFYFEKSISQAKEVLGKMKELIKTSQMLTFNDCAIINLFEALVTEKYIDSEEHYSKSLIFALFQYGDPRGKRSQGHLGMMYPLWKIARQTCALENSLTNENFKEMFHCLSDITQSQGKLLNELKDCEESNQSKGLFKSETITKETTAKEMNNKQLIQAEANNLLSNSMQDEPNECSFDDEGIENIKSKEKACLFRLSPTAFENEDCHLIKPFAFPPTSDLKSSYLKVFLCKEYALFILKTLMAMTDDEGSLITEDLLDIISMNFIIKIRENNSTIGMTALDALSLKKKNGTVLSHYIFDELMEKMSFKQSLPEVLMLSFGKNAYNETTHDNYDMLSLPRVAYKLKDFDIVKVIGGWEHNFIIDKKGKCYGWGRNQHGQCGVGTEGIIRTPRRVLFEDKELQVKAVSCGNEHSLFLTSKGEVFACGNSEDGVIGLNYKANQYTPIQLKELSNIESVSCGTIHNLALDKDGAVFSWGSSRGGQLGFDDEYISSQGNSIFLSKPTKIASLPGKIKQISAGEAHSIALSERGTVYGWGFSSNGQLGLGFCEDSFEPGTGQTKSKVVKPQLINNLPSISSIHCGKIFSMFISKQKELFACGGNDVNQLGIEDLPSTGHLFDKNDRCFDFVLPTPIESFFSMKVLKVACGESHCLAIVSDPLGAMQNVWSWGNNRFGQLGIGKHFKAAPPKPINYLLSYYNSSIENIACGGYHSLCLLKSKVKSNQQEDEEMILNAINFFSF